jgi:hypothetical protein
MTETRLFRLFTISSTMKRHNLMAFIACMDWGQNQDLAGAVLNTGWISSIEIPFQGFLVVNLGDYLWKKYWKKYLTVVIAYSDAFRPLIPIDSGHLFRSIPAGHSDSFRPPPWEGMRAVLDN